MRVWAALLLVAPLAVAARTCTLARDHSVADLCHCNTVKVDKGAHAELAPLTRLLTVTVTKECMYTLSLPFLQHT